MGANAMLSHVVVHRFVQNQRQPNSMVTSR
jgi:hypothetical protein